MTSPSPLLYDTYYHIYNRGVNRENIFIEERNYDLFLRLYEKHLMPLVDTFAYCMLRNHFHICLRTKSKDEILDIQKTLRVSSVNHRHDKQETIANQEESQSRKPLGSKFLSDHFSNFFNAYAKTMNKAYGRTGSLFQHPFGRVPITSDHQFWNVIAYIHQNPQKHGFVKDFRDWKYSSYEVLLTGKKTILNRAETMKWFGTKAEYLSLHSHWVTDAQAGWFAKDDYD